MKKFVLLPFEKYQRLTNVSSSNNNKEEEKEEEHVSEILAPKATVVESDNFVEDPVVQQTNEKITTYKPLNDSASIPPPGEPKSVTLEEMVIVCLLWS